MPDKPWKRAERKAAEAIGGKRNPLSGGNSGHTRSDIIHPTIYLEMKYRKSFAVVEQIRKEEVKAKKEGKVAIMGFQQKGIHTRYYLIPEPLMVILMSHLPMDGILLKLGGNYESNRRDSGFDNSCNLLGMGETSRTGKIDRKE